MFLGEYLIAGIPNIWLGIPASHKNKLEPRLAGYFPLFTKANTPDSSYTATLLPVGTYTVAAEQGGFSRTVQSNVELGVGQVANVNLVLKVGQIDEQVQVTDAPPLIDTQSSAVGTIETDSRIVALPLNGRNFVQLAYLSAGANNGQAGGNLRQGTVENPRS